MWSHRKNYSYTCVTHLQRLISLLCTAKMSPSRNNFQPSLFRHFKNGSLQDDHQNTLEDSIVYILRMMDHEMREAWEFTCLFYATNATRRHKCNKFPLGTIIVLPIQTQTKNKQTKENSMCLLPVSTTFPDTKISKTILGLTIR